MCINVNVRVFVSISRINRKTKWFSKAQIYVNRSMLWEKSTQPKNEIQEKLKRLNCYTIQK